MLKKIARLFVVMAVLGLAACRAKPPAVVQEEAAPAPAVEIFTPPPPPSQAPASVPSQTPHPTRTPRPTRQPVTDQNKPFIDLLHKLAVKLEVDAYLFNWYITTQGALAQPMNYLNAILLFHSTTTLEILKASQALADLPAEPREYLTRLVQDSQALDGAYKKLLTTPALLTVLDSSSLLGTSGARQKEIETYLTTRYDLPAADLQIQRQSVIQASLQTLGVPVPNTLVAADLPTATSGALPADPSLPSRPVSLPQEKIGAGNAAKIKPLVRINGDRLQEVTTLAFSADGRSVASGASNGVFMYRLENNLFSQVWGQAGALDPVRSLAFAPQGEALAVGYASGSVRLLSAAQGTPHWQISGPPNITDLAFSPDGQVLAVAAEGSVRFLQAASGEEQQPAQKFQSAGLAFTPDGQVLITSQAEQVIFWDMRQGQILRTIQAHSQRVTDLALAPDGKFLVTGSQDKTIKVWQVDTGRLVRTLADSQGVVGVAFSPDGTLIGSLSEAGPLKIWNAEDGRTLATLNGRRKLRGYGLVFSPDGLLLANIVLAGGIEARDDWGVTALLGIQP